MSDSTPAVEVRNVTKAFQPSLKREYIIAVEGLSLTVNAGEVYGLIGPNGSGKSTTMKIVLGLMRATRGTTRIFGHSSGTAASRQNVGFLPENPYFYKHLSGEETLKFYGKLCGLRGRELKDRIGEMLQMVDLENARTRRLGGYSKGMLQRIGLAQAMIQRPRLVILDEPTAGVDPVGSRQIRDLIFQLKEDGISVFLCSHLLEQVQEVCDRVGIIFNGRMRREGNLDDLIAIEDQSEIVLQGASAETIAKLTQLAEQEDGTRVLRTGRPRTTLERLFLEEVGRPNADVKAAEAELEAGKEEPS
jgi:ABC-2 type transport system ATP-binding protein